MPNSYDELEEQNRRTLRRAELAALKPISFADLQAVFDKWMIVPDRGIVKFITACYCANRLPGKALWAIIIGPSGGGKTEFLNSLVDLEDVVPISTLTPSTFLSGMPGQKDASLLPRLSGKVALFKDWTTIMSMQKDARAEIFSQFREIWDGEMKKIFGTGAVRSWVGKVTVLAGSTQAVDLHQQQYTHLGERFMNYRPVMPDRKKAAMRALNNDKNQEQMGKEIRNAMVAFMKSIDFAAYAQNPPAIPEEIKDEIVNLANFSTMARSGIIRDFGFKKDVIFVPDSEMPTRITGQLAKLGAGLMMSNEGKLDPNDVAIIYKCALDSIPMTNKMVIREMARADGQTTKQIATALGYPTEPIRMYLENLAMLKVCTRTQDSGRGDKWTMNPEFSTLVRHYEGIAELTDEERRNREDDDESSAKVDREFEEFGHTAVPA